MPQVFKNFKALIIISICLLVSLGKTSSNNLLNSSEEENLEHHFLKLEEIMNTNIKKENFFANSQSNIDFADAVKLIKENIQQNFKFKGSAYNRTAYLVDTFGPRLWGSPALQDAVEFMRDELIKEGFENIKLEENKNSLHWVRGKETLTLFSPRKYPTKIPMVGLGKSIGGNVTGELIVVESFDDLEENKNNIEGKIVLFNKKWTNYDEGVIYRASGASRAVKYGAVGCLVRSVTPVSIESPHGGALFYDEKLPKIPAAAISIEDAEMFARMQKRGQRIELNLYMEAHYEEKVSTFNLIGEIQGSEFPKEVILIGGHIDSWDVGPQTGANDDAAGFMVCMEAVRMLLQLNLRPKRTIRFIAWAGEEFGDENSGAPSYAKLHENELEDHIMAFESDSGTTEIFGWGFSGSEAAYKIFNALNEKYLKDALNLNTVRYGDGIMVDTTPLYQKGIPVVRNLIKDTPDEKFYFTYHHSAGDSVSVLDTNDMDSNVAAIASMFYIIADFPFRIPRN